MTTLYKVDGTAQELLSIPTLEEAQALVGGYVEVVYPRNAPGVIFLCDEDGLSKNKFLNSKGCQLYGSPIIVGDIIVMTRKEARGIWA